MNFMELIDKLCHVTTVLSDIVRKQAEIIRQNGIAIYDNDAKTELKKAQENADAELDEIEYKLRRF